jgi:hypothetical protein
LRCEKARHILMVYLLIKANIASELRETVRTCRDKYARHKVVARTTFSQTGLRLRDAKRTSP